MHIAQWKKSEVYSVYLRIPWFYTTSEYPLTPHTDLLSFSPHLHSAISTNLRSHLHRRCVKAPFVSYSMEPLSSKTNSSRLRLPSTLTSQRLALGSGDGAGWEGRGNLRFTSRKSTTNLPIVLPADGFGSRSNSASPRLPRVGNPRAPAAPGGNHLSVFLP